jgi:hypothetical protein
LHPFASIQSNGAASRIRQHFQRHNRKASLGQSAEMRNRSVSSLQLKAFGYFKETASERFPTYFIVILEINSFVPLACNQ